VIWTLGAALVQQYAAQLIHTVHLFLFRADGSGLHILEVLSEILFVLSQMIQYLLLIVLALGYTLQRSIDDISLTTLLSVGLVAIVHIVLVVIGKWHMSGPNRFHEYDGAQGWLVFFIRLALYVAFLASCQQTLQTTRNFKIQAFLKQFRLAGSLYLLAFPALFLLTKLFASYWQLTVLTSGMMAMQVSSNFWLASLFLRRGDYFEVSSLSSSALPQRRPSWQLTSTNKEN